MATETMIISLSEAMRAYVAQRVELGQYGNPSQYLCELIVKDQREQQVQRLRELVIDGLVSGPATPDAPEDWVELHAIARGAIG